MELFDDFSLGSSAGDDLDFFLFSGLFNRFNGFECSYGLLIIVDFVLLCPNLDNSDDSTDFLDGGEIGRLLMSYADRSTRSNFRKH